MTDNPTEPPKPSGRGPTRPAVKFADLAEDVAKLDDESRAAFRAALESGTTPKTLRESAKQERKLAREAMDAAEGRARQYEADADLVERAMCLTDTLRKALLAVMDEEPAE